MAEEIVATLQDRLNKTTVQLHEADNAKHAAEHKARELENRVKALFLVVMRFLVVLKYLFRAGALVGCYYWLGKYPAIGLLGFILLVASLQTAIDKVQRTMHPDWNSSEWSF